MQTLREIMTHNIRGYGWLDYCYERGDDNAKSYKSYEEWLWSLADDDFLDAYNRVRDAELKLD